MAGNGYATTSRKKILEYLMANSDRTVTVTDIDQYLKKHDNEVNITTIYRYLDKLAKEGTVMKYVAEKGSQAVSPADASYIWNVRLWMRSLSMF